MIKINYTDRQLPKPSKQNIKVKQCNKCISKEILDRLNCVFYLEDFFKQENIKHEEFVKEIEDVLNKMTGGIFK